MLVSLLCGSAQAQTRIGTVDLRTVFDKYWKRQQADAAIKAHVADLRKQFDSMYNDYKKSADEYQKVLDSANDQAVSEGERDRRKKEAEAKLKDLKTTKDSLDEYNRQSRATVDEQLNRMRASILKEIQAVVKAKAEAGGYSIVLDSAAVSANQTPILLYVNNPQNDLTEAVLQQLNATAPPGFTNSPSSSMSGTGN